ncbi:hypothetical protein P692DRAFT_20751438, partial [Suillus brevipes Sb2]
IHREYLKTLNLTINEELRILCCEICCVAVPQDNAKTHIKTQHSEKTFDAAKFAKVMAEEGVRSDMPNLQGPRSLVKELAVHDALACSHCNKVLTNIKGMRNHHTDTHRGIAMPREWRACKAQQLRSGGPGTHQMLWEVEGRIEGEVQARTKELIGAIMKEMETVLRVVEAPEDKREVSPWLLTTGWHEHLAGQKAEDLMDLAALPKKDDELMPFLKESVQAYYESALALVSTTDEVTLQRLNSPDPGKK